MRECICICMNDCMNTQSEIYTLESDFSPKYIIYKSTENSESFTRENKLLVKFLRILKNTVASYFHLVDLFLVLEITLRPLVHSSNI